MISSEGNSEMFKKSFQTGMKKYNCIQSSDPGKVLDLIVHLADDDCSDLQCKINAYLGDECDAEEVFMVVVNLERSEAYIESVGRSTLDKKYKLLDCQKFMAVIKSAYHQSTVYTDLYDDVKKLVGPYLRDSCKKHVTMVPIVGQPWALVVCLVAPKEQEEHVVTYVYECFLMCWSTIKKTIQLEYERNVKHKCQHLLRVSKKLFTQVTSLETLMKLAADQGKRVVNAEHCSILIIDLDKMELVETCYHGGTDESYERRLPMQGGIVGQVIQTGTLVNTRNTVEHPAYDPEIDGQTAIKIKNSLTFPIREQGGIIGVGVLYNKIGDPFFDSMDEETVLSYSVYCGVCIIHSVVYKKIMEASIRNVLANEMVMYHIEVSDAEVTKVLECKGYHHVPDFTSLFFNSRGLALRELPCLVLRMFNDLGFIRKYKAYLPVAGLDAEHRGLHRGIHTVWQSMWTAGVHQEYSRFNLKQWKLVRFILYVRKSYRDVPYHNWCHAFSVTQWAYAAIMNFQLVRKGYLTDLQAMMYLIACLVHDLDHRGAPCNYQVNGQTALAAHYTSEGSVIERHHLGQAVSILNMEGCDILEPLPRRDYDRALLLLRDFVLATDLTNFLKKLNEYKMITCDYLIGNHIHIAALQALLMNGADFSDQIKDWNSVKKTAAEVLTEFFNQDETEKGRGEIPSIFENPNNRTIIPDLEIQFMTEICLPIYDMLGNIFPAIETASRVIEGHLVLWDGSRDVFTLMSVVEGLSALLSPELDQLIEAALAERERLRLEAEQLAAEEAAAAAAAAAALAEEED